MVDEMVEPDAKSDVGDLVRVPDDEGDRHGLAEGAAEAEHNGADDADAGKGSVPPWSPPPSWSSPCRRPLSLSTGGTVRKTLTQHRRHEGQDHDGEDDPAVSTSSRSARPS